MKEIEFRAWHVDKKRFYEVIALYLMTKKLIISDGQRGGYIPFTSVTLEQYSGIKDKQITPLNPEGQKLYEGDIVKKSIHTYNTHYDFNLQSYGEREEEIEGDLFGVIRFMPSLGFTIKKIYFKDDIEGTVRKETGYTNIVASRTQKLGNIHENPELLLFEEGGQA